MKYAARVLVVDDAGRFLVLHNIKHNRWEFPGGKVKQNESFQSVAKRELKEETGLAVRGPLSYVTWVVLRVDDGEGETEWSVDYFSTRYTSTANIEEPRKFDRMKFVNVEDLSTLPSIPALTVDIARHMLRHG